MYISVDDKQLPVDKEGFLKQLEDWSPAAARHIAEAEGIKMTDAHWEIIELLREFYRCYEISPAMRALVKYTKQQLGEDKGRSIYLMRLFPRSPAKQASKIAGLPKPPNCL